MTQIPKQKAGVGIYAENLVGNILERDCVNPYWLLTQNDDESLNMLAVGHSNVVVLKVRSSLFRHFWLRFFLEQLYIPYLTRKYRIDVIHSLHYSLPLLPSRAKKVVTIHDMTFFLFPELHTLVKRHYFRLFTRLAASFADGLIFASQSTANDFVRLLGRRQRYTVIHLGRKTVFVGASDVVAATKQKYGIRGRYLLFIGTIEPRKNLPNLFAAFRRLVDGGFEGQLVVVGKSGWHCDHLEELVATFGLTQSIVFTGFVEEHTKWCLLSGATAFVYPSIYEGFGIPVLEALSLGVPTMTSAVSSLPEVAGDAALLIDPLNVEEMYTALRALCEDEGLRRSLAAKGLARSQKFSWSAAADQTCDFYRQVGSGTGDGDTPDAGVAVGTRNG